MFLRVFIPRFHHIEQGSNSAAVAAAPSAVASTSEGSGPTPTPHSATKSHFVYEIEISTEGKFYRIQRRYSQFLTLHNEVYFNLKRLVRFQKELFTAAAEEIIPDSGVSTEKVEKL